MFLRPEELTVQTIPDLFSDTSVRSRKSLRWGFDVLEHEGSMLIPGENSMGRAIIAARKFAQRKGWRIATRSTPNGLVLWRTDASIHEAMQEEHSLRTSQYADLSQGQSVIASGDDVERARRSAYSYARFRGWKIAAHISSVGLIVLRIE